MVKMFDSLQVVENPVQKTRSQDSAKANRLVNERMLLLALAATMGLSTVALLGVLAVSA
jgi:hypothetical protein